MNNLDKITEKYWLEYGQKDKYTGSEDSLQTQTHSVLKNDPRFTTFFHVANERKTKTKIARNGRRYSPSGMLLQKKGVRSGVSDWIIIYKTAKHGGMAVELKVKGGTLRESQKAFLRDCHNQGFFTAVVWSVDGFKECINDFFNQ